MQSSRSNFGIVLGFLALGFVFLVNVDVAIADPAKSSVSEDVVAAELGIDPTSYKQSERIRDFLEIAFSETFWDSDDGETYPKRFREFIARFDKIIEPTTEDQKYGLNRHPWYEGLEYKAAGFPRDVAINKWSRPIAISFGWPRYEVIDDRSKTIAAQMKADADEWRRLNPDKAKLIPINDNKNPIEFDLKKKYGANYDEAVQQINRLMPVLSKATGLSVSYIPPDSSSEETDAYARIRIIAVADDENYKPYAPWRAYSAVQGDQFWAGVSFTPNLKNHVNGYFIADADNMLNLAVCKINFTAPANIVRERITECLIRALGLPDLSKNTLSGVLGDVPAVAARPESFNEYDLQMVRILYCDAIKPSMDKYQAIAALVKNKDCLAD